MDVQENDDDLDIYGDDPSPTPSSTVANEPVENPINEIPKVIEQDIKEIPTVRAQVSGLGWWITDETIKQQLSTIGRVVELELFQIPSNGKFNGIFECWIQTEHTETQVANQIKQLNFGQTDEISVLTGNSIKSNMSKQSTSNYMLQNDVPQLKPPPKPAPMLYDDPRNPIPRNLLPFDSRKDVDSDMSERSKRPDSDSKRSKKSDRDRDKRRSDRGWRRDRDRRDYDYDYDYNYDEKDYRSSRRDDRDDYYDRDRRRRDDDREDRHRDKRRK